MPEEKKELHGTVIARLAYELDGPVSMVGKDGEPYTASHKTIGLLIFYRTGEAQVRLDMIPLSAWIGGDEWFIGNFIPSEKVPEAPFVDGDLVASTDTRGEPVTVGHIHARQNEFGMSQYYMRLYGIPVSGWRRAIQAGEGKSLYLRVTQ
jgi:hypothetical protein